MRGGAYLEKKDCDVDALKQTDKICVKKTRDNKTMYVFAPKDFDSEKNCNAFITKLDIGGDYTCKKISDSKYDIVESAKTKPAKTQTQPRWK